MRFTSPILLAFVAVTAAVLAGCGSPEKSTAKTESDAGAAAKIEKALAGLSDEDRKLAEAQEVCPVSDKKLGSMKTPVKVEDVNGQDVFICCAGCEDSLREDPDKFLAKLKKEN